MIRRHVAGFEVRNTVFDVFARFLRLRLGGRAKTVVFFANANFVARCQELRARMRKPHVFIVPDGAAMNLASWILFGRGFRQNLNGTDFVPNFLATVTNKTFIYLVGGRPESVRRAAEEFAKLDQIEVVGMRDGYSLWQAEQDAVTDISRSRADLVLVALGNPLQEEWILQHEYQLDGVTMIGVGALFDFLSGSQKRAPRIVRSLRLEWLYRLVQEPRRLASRYTIGIVRFFGLAMADHLRRIRAARRNETSYGGSRAL
jgi:beta-1,4-glucosyltransferase